jgi:hypothetical protein
MAQRELVVGSEPVAVDVVSVADTTNLPPSAAQAEKPVPAARVDTKPKVDARRQAETKAVGNAKPQPPAPLKPETKKAQPPPKADPPVQAKPQPPAEAKPQQAEKLTPQQPAQAKPQQAEKPKPQPAAKAEAQPAPPQPAPPPVPERDKAMAPAPPPKPVPQREKPAQQAPATVAENEPASAPPEAKPSPAVDFQSVLKSVGTLGRSDAKKPVAQATPPKAETEAGQADGKAKNADAPEQAFASRIKEALNPGAATAPASASGRTYNAAQPVTVSEIDEVRRQIERCWNIPAGAGDYVVTIRVEMSPDATPRSAIVVNEATMQGSAFHRAAAESALRAVLNPRCHPFKLPVEKYDRWKTMTLVFNPKDMLGT